MIIISLFLNKIILEKLWKIMHWPVLYKLYSHNLSIDLQKWEADQCSRTIVVMIEHRQKQFNSSLQGRGCFQLYWSPLKGYVYLPRYVDFQKSHKDNHAAHIRYSWPYFLILSLLWLAKDMIPRLDASPSILIFLTYIYTHLGKWFNSICNFYVLVCIKLHFCANCFFSP